MKTKVTITSTDLNKGFNIDILRADKHYSIRVFKGKRDKLSGQWLAQSQLPTLTPATEMWVSSATSPWTTALKNTLRLLFSIWESEDE